MISDIWIALGLALLTLAVVLYLARKEGGWKLPPKSYRARDEAGNQ